MNPCCEKKENLEPHEKRGKDAVVMRCKKCGRRHYFMQADAGKIGLRGARM